MALYGNLLPGQTPSWHPILEPIGSANAQLLGGVIVAASGAVVFAGGIAIGSALIAFEEILAIESLGASMLLTVHSLALSGTITATGVTIFVKGREMIINSRSSDAALCK